MCCLQLLHAGSRSFISPRMNLWLPRIALVARDPPLFLQLFSLAEVPTLIQALDVGYPFALPHGSREVEDAAKAGRACSAHGGSRFLGDPQMLIGCPSF